MQIYGRVKSSIIKAWYNVQYEMFAVFMYIMNPSVPCQMALKDAIVPDLTICNGTC